MQRISSFGNSKVKKDLIPENLKSTTIPPTHVNGLQNCLDFTILKNDLFEVFFFDILASTMLLNSFIISGLSLPRK